MFAITEKPAVLYLKTQNFDELQLKWIQLMFLQMKSTRYNLKRRSCSFFNHARDC